MFVNVSMPLVCRVEISSWDPEYFGIGPGTPFAKLDPDPLIFADNFRQSLLDASRDHPVTSNLTRATDSSDQTQVNNPQASAKLNALGIRVCCAQRIRTTPRPRQNTPTVSTAKC